MLTYIMSQVFTILLMQKRLSQISTHMAVVTVMLTILHSAYVDDLRFSTVGFKLVYNSLHTTFHTEGTNLMHFKGHFKYIDFKYVQILHGPQFSP